MPKVSIVIPFYKMQNWQFFLNRCLGSVFNQTFKDYEIVLTNKGKWSENHNAGIRQAQGVLIKFLHMDDWLTNDDSLEEMVKNFKGGWMMVGCSNNQPKWTDDLHLGNNKLGNPSCLIIDNKNPLLFDESLTWVVDCDYYLKLFKRYGKPALLPGMYVSIGVHKGQASNLIPVEVKLKEHKYLYDKYSRATTNNR